MRNFDLELTAKSQRDYFRIVRPGSDYVVRKRTGDRFPYADISVLIDLR
jgi:hypothetical protein